MVQHTQTIHQQKPTNCVSVFGHFWALALEGLTFYFGIAIFGGSLTLLYILKRNLISIKFSPQS